MIDDVLLLPTFSREVIELVNGSLPFLYLSTQCHCPPSHPVVNVQNSDICMQHTAPNLTPRGTVSRLNSLSRNTGYVNDLSGTNQWISSPGVRNVAVTINLTQSLYEVRNEAAFCALCSED